MLKEMPITSFIAIASAKKKGRMVEGNTENQNTQMSIIQTSAVTGDIAKQR
jgi:hypothetical protein